jgi:hypothetical protein
VLVAHVARRRSCFSPGEHMTSHLLTVSGEADLLRTARRQRRLSGLLRAARSVAQRTRAHRTPVSPWWCVAGGLPPDARRTKPSNGPKEGGTIKSSSLPGQPATLEWGELEIVGILNKADIFTRSDVFFISRLRDGAAGERLMFQVGIKPIPGEDLTGFAGMPGDIP